MLSIEEVKRTVESLKKAEQDVVSLKAEMNMVKKQAKEIFEKYSMKGFSDISILQDKLKKAEEDITISQKEAEEFIMEVNKIKQQTENILMG